MTESDTVKRAMKAHVHCQTDGEENQMWTDMYCWLENRERRLLPASPEFERWLDPKRTAVVCIDMHRGHIGPDEDVTCPAPRARARIDAHNAFHSRCRAIDIPIIHVLYSQRPGGVEDLASRHPNRKATWRLLYELYLPPNPLMNEHGVEGSKWLDIMVDREPQDFVVKGKKGSSAFYPTDLEFLLRHLGAYTVVLTGTYTDACVVATAFDAADRDLRVLVPRDIVAGYSEAAEDAGLLLISLHAGLVVDSDALLREWDARMAAEPEPAAQASRAGRDGEGVPS